MDRKKLRVIKDIKDHPHHHPSPFPLYAQGRVYKVTKDIEIISNTGDIKNIKDIKGQKMKDIKNIKGINIKEIKDIKDIKNIQDFRNINDNRK